MKLKQEKVIELANRLTKDKAEVEKRFAKGATLTDVAAIYKVQPSSFKRIARAVGVEVPVRAPSDRVVSKLLFRDILTVLVRLCKELKVPYDELEPYLEPKEDKGS